MTTFIGYDGEYRIYNHSYICQTKLNLEGEPVSNNIVHLRVESIENQDDQRGIKYKLSEIELEDIADSVLG